MTNHLSRSRFLRDLLNPLERFCREPQNTGDLSYQDPILPRHGMQRTANTLGLKVTAESKKNFIKKGCAVDKYRRMAG